MNIIHQELNAEIVRKNTFLYEGEFRGILKDANGKVVYDSGWVKNSFTDYGLDTRNSSLNYLAVGSGTNPTSLSTVRLTNFLADKPASYIQAYPCPPGGPYRFGTMLRAIFNPGDFVGDVNEIALSSGSTFNRTEYVCCREVFPTTITVSPDNTLEVFYRVYCTVNAEDTVGEVVINGITYDYIMRPIDIFDYKNAFRAIAIRSGSSLGTGREELLLGLEDTFPGAFNTQSMALSNTSYANRTMNWTMTAYLDSCNFATGVKSVYSRLFFIINNGDSPGYGAQFLAKDGPNIGYGIIKNDLQYLNVNFEMSWGQI